MSDLTKIPSLPRDAAEIVRARSDNRTDARIEDVARACNVSIMSVSRAMRGVEGVSAATREKVQRMARQLGYQPSSVAGSLAAANSTLIGISVPTLHDEVFSDIFDAMRAVFTRAGFQTVFDTTDY
ncbi:MAG: LacI family DNA-binding transcriptional regulator, partial [Pseudomonadota bacterium]